MAEGLDRDGAFQLGVDAVEEIEVELGGDAGRVVIGAGEHLHVLDAVHADQEVGADAERFLHGAQEIDGGAGDQVADRGAGEEAELHRVRDLGRQRDRLHEVRLDRVEG